MPNCYGKVQMLNDKLRQQQNDALQCSKINRQNDEIVQGLDGQTKNESGKMQV